MSKTPVSPETQAFSDALMMLRFAQLEVKKLALVAQNKLQLAKNAAMDGGVKMMASDLGFAEAALLRMAAAYGDTQALHAAISEWARDHNMDLPAAPTYDPEYLAMANEEVPVKLSAHLRR